MKAMKNLIIQHRVHKLLALMALFPFVANSLTLGRITSNSLQSEPLDADILLEDIEPGVSIDQVYVAKISADDYWQSGLTYELYHDEMEFKPFVGKDNKWYIKATTASPIDTSFVNFMLKVEYPFGEASREYMSVLKRPILAEKKVYDEEVMPEEYYNFELASTNGASTIQRIDNFSPVAGSDKYHDEYIAHETTQDLTPVATPKPAAIATIKKAEPVVKKELATAKPGENLDKGIQKQIKEAVAKEINKLQAEKQAETDKQAAKKAASKPIVQYRSVDTTTFMTRKGDTLWDIAKSFTTDNNNINKMVMTIYTNNKQAFINQNINLLKQNAKLNIPSEASLSSVDHRLALNFLINNTKTFANSNASLNTGKVNKRTSAAPSGASKLAKLVNDAKPSIAKPTVAQPSIMSEPKPLVSNKTNIKSDIQLNSLNGSKTPSLKILADDSSSLTNRLIIASEKLIAGQKENKELKEQVVILQAQIKDIKKLLDMRKAEEARTQLAAAEQMLVREDVETSYNPFSTVDIPAIQQSVAQMRNTTASTTQEQSMITTGSAMLQNTASHSTIAKTQDSVAVNNRVTGYIGSKVDSISKVGHDLVGNQSKIMLILMVLFTAGLFGALLVYLYWRRNYRMQQVMPDLSAGRNHIFVDDIQSYEQDDYIEEEIAARHAHTGTKFRDNFDLVKAYIELNDFVTAKKILNEIVRTGNTEQRARAKRILHSMSAA